MICHFMAKIVVNEQGNMIVGIPIKPCKHGISGQFKEFDNYDKSIIYLPRQYNNKNYKN